MALSMALQLPTSNRAVPPCDGAAQRADGLLLLRFGCPLATALAYVFRLRLVEGWGFGASERLLTSLTTKKTNYLHLDYSA